MHILAGQVARDIKQQGLSAVYEPELSRVWPEPFALDAGSEASKSCQESFYIHMNI